MSFLPAIRTSVFFEPSRLGVLGMGALGVLVRILAIAIVGNVLGHRDDFSDGYHYQRAFPQDVMVDVINNFGLALLEAHNERNDNNIALSPYGATSVLVALGEGLRGPAVYEIQDAARIPLDTSVIRIGLRDIHRHLKSYFIPKEGFLAGLTLSSEKVPLNFDYEAVLRFYGYDVDSFNNPLYPDFDSTTQANATEGMAVATPSGAEGKSTEVTESTSANDVTITVRATIETTTESNPENESTITLKTTEIPSTKGTTTRETTTESNSENGSTITLKTTEITSTEISITKGTTTTEITTESIPENVTTIELKTTEITGTEIPTMKGSTMTEPTIAGDLETTTPPKNEVGGEIIAVDTTKEITTTESSTTDSTTKSFKPTSEEKTTTSTTIDALSTSSDSSNQRTTRQDHSSTLPVSTVDVDASTNLSNVESMETTESNSEATTESITSNVDDTVDTTTDKTATSTQDSESSTSDVVIVTSVTKSVSASISEGNTDASDDGDEDGDEETTEETTNAVTGRKSRSIVDYIIAKYHDNVNEQWGGAYSPDETPSFFIYGRLKEPNINFMTYDAVLPFAYIPMLNAMALSFPLDSKEYYLLLVLPVEIGGVDRVICDFKRTSLKEIVGSLKYTHVKAVIPSFTLKGYVVLTPTLQKLGIKRIFEPRHSDFSPMTMEKDVYVTNIEQAVTVTIRNYVDPDKLPNYRSLQQFRPVEYKADRPFLYFVMDSRVHVCLMAGKIVNPLNSRIR